LHGKPPILRKVAWALPERLQPGESRTLWVIAVDNDGRIVHDLQGPGDRYHMVTGVRRRAGRVYLGSLVEPAVAVLEL
jgi:hypothetical protein